MLRRILTFLDSLIPVKTSPPQVKVRLRLVAAYYLISSVSLSVYLILGIALNFLHSSFSSILAFALILNILAIVLIRRSYPVDKVVVSNICLRLIISTLDFLMFSKSANSRPSVSRLGSEFLPPGLFRPRPEL